MIRVFANRSHRIRRVVLAIAALCLVEAAQAQPIDCNRLAAQIAAAGRGSAGNDYAAAAQKQRAELARTTAYGNSLGCDRPNFFLFGERPPQCASINAQISRMQANLQGLQGAAYGGDGGRAALQARFDAYCRTAGGYDTARGFFERLFDTSRQDRFSDSQPDILAPEPDNEPGARGGSQALCVRTCDGGFFPLSVSARRRDLGDLQELCTALCPNTEAKLFTRVPGREINSAVSVDGEAYANLPNALKFEKAFDKACTCKPANKSWVEALADAERILGDGRKGDIVVTPERAEELSRLAGPGAGRERKKFDPREIAKSLAAPSPQASEPTSGSALRGSESTPTPKPEAPVASAAGGKPRVRVIPQ